MTDTVSGSGVAQPVRATSRRLWVLAGAPEATLAAARSLLARVAADQTWWVEHARVVTSAGLTRVDAALGRECQVLVLSAHGGLDGETLGRCHGFVRGGGALVVRVNDSTPERRFDQRFLRLVYPWADGVWREGEPLPGPLELIPFETTGTAEQGALVTRLGAAFEAALGPRGEAAHHVVTADRGRGKSAAIGLALAQVGALAGADDIVGASADPDGFMEMQRFSGPCRVTWTTLTGLLDLPVDGSGPAIVVVDEAARVPVATLRRLVERYPGATFVFATTTHGYEGTGRGFVLKFQRWLRDGGRVVVEHRLVAPIRWCTDDRLERFVFDVLLLDADMPALPASGDTVCVARIDRDALATDDNLLGEVFGLLLQAHYRTTPRDLEVLLDGANVELHAARVGEMLAGVCMVAHEGGLDPAMAAAAAAGKVRLAGQALADCLVAHMGCVEAGPLAMVRSVRIATHPGLRRRGVARSLVEAVHAAYRPDLFGTLFGADAGLIAFRRALGYEVVRVSAARGARTGEPSVMMLRGASPAGQAMVATARAAYEREAAERLGYLKADHELVPDAALEAALLAGVAGVGSVRADGALMERVASWVASPRTFEQSCGDLRSFVLQYRSRLVELPPADATLIETRVIERAPWAVAARAAGLAHAGQALRRLRPALRLLYESVSRPATGP